MSVVVPATETPGPGAPGAARRGRWDRVGWALGLEAAAGGVDRQAAPTGRWARAGWALGLEAAAGGVDRQAARRPPCRARGLWFGVNSCRDTGIAQCRGRASSLAQPSPAGAPQPLGSTGAPGPSLWVVGRGAWGPLAAASLAFRKRDPVSRAAVPPWRWACQVGTNGHSHGDLHRRP